MKRWQEIVACPRCRSALHDIERQPACSNSDCAFSREKFPLAEGQPVLIDFENSIFARADYARSNGSVLHRDVTRKSLAARVHQFINGPNSVAPRQGRKFLDLLKQQTSHPVILVIGGGQIGSGADCLYEEPQCEIVGTDVYASVHTDLLADAHRLPFVDASFDGVWLQAVLEHVLDPKDAVAEIHRVLKPHGIVYAETPFMQQVHEGGYDFTRFTLSGHRWLFRHFEQIDAGRVSGPAVAFVWSIRYLSRALGASSRLSRLISMPFFWIRYLDRFAHGRNAVDASSGIFFFGRRADHAISPKAMPAYYDEQRK